LISLTAEQRFSVIVTFMAAFQVALLWVVVDLARGAAAPAVWLIVELLDLSATAGSYCREVAAQQNVTIDFLDAAAAPIDLPQEVSLQLFRVLQESLSNAITHSGERHVVVRLRGVDDDVELEVSDRGRGFDPAAALAGRGTGLVGMYERLGLVGGTLSIDSRPGDGTTVQARVPRLPGVNTADHGREVSSPLVLSPDFRE